MEKIVFVIAFLCVGMANAHQLWVVNNANRNVDVAFDIHSFHSVPPGKTVSYDIGNKKSSFQSNYSGIGVFDPAKRGQTKDGWPMDGLAFCDDPGAEKSSNKTVTVFNAPGTKTGIGCRVELKSP